MQAIETGQEAERDKDYSLALTNFDLVIAYARSAPLAHFERAKVLAMTGKKQDAIAAVKAAIDGGFADRKLLLATPELASLQPLPEFQALLAAMPAEPGT